MPTTTTDIKGCHHRSHTKTSVKKSFPKVIGRRVIEILPCLKLLRSNFTLFVVKAGQIKNIKKGQKEF